MEITSRSNPFIAHVRKLVASSSYRKETGLFVGDGIKLAKAGLDALAATHSGINADFLGKIDTIIATEESRKQIGHIPEEVEEVTIPPHLMEWISPMKTPQGALFIGKIPTLPENPDINKQQYLILENVQDPGNVGTIWRTVQGLGTAGLILVGNCASPWNPKTIRSAMGACFHVPILHLSYEELISHCESRNLPLVATCLDKESQPLGEISLEKVAVVLGSEGRGISEELLRCCQKKVYLPMQQFCESLNVATVGSILLWEMAKNQKSKT